MDALYGQDRRFWVWMCVIGSVTVEVPVSFEAEVAVIDDDGAGER